MIKKPYLLMIINIVIFFCYKNILKVTNIKTNYEKWKQFYEKNNISPFSYIKNFLPFQMEELFIKISNFESKLSFFMINTGYNTENFEEEEESNQIELYNNTNNNNKIHSLLSTSDLNYENYYDHAIDEINIIEDAVENNDIVNIKTILEEGLNKNKVIILFMFFVEQLNIFKFLKQNFDLNKIYLLGRNRTRIERLEEAYEIIFNYEDLLEIIMYINQFIDYHKDYGFFTFDELKNEKNPTISVSDKKMINMIFNLKNINYNEYKNLNDLELSLFLDIFEKTTRCVYYLGMSESLYKKGKLYYNRDINTLRLGFIAFALFINIFIMMHYDDKEKKVIKRKKY
jgi:hypothetical protein